MTRCRSSSATPPPGAIPPDAPRRPSQWPATFDNNEKLCGALKKSRAPQRGARSESTTDGMTTPASAPPGTAPDVAPTTTASPALKRAPVIPTPAPHPAAAMHPGIASFAPLGYAARGAVPERRPGVPRDRPHAGPGRRIIQPAAGPQLHRAAARAGAGGGARSGGGDRLLPGDVRQRSARDGPANRRRDRSGRAGGRDAGRTGGVPRSVDTPGDRSRARPCDQRRGGRDA